MRINEVDTFRLSIPYVDEPRSQWVNQWGIQLYTKVGLGGVHGWGETLVAGSGIIEAYKHVIDDIISKLLMESEFEDIGVLTGRLEKSLFTAGISGVVAGSMSGVELALWDAYARTLDKPISAIMGGGQRTSVPVYASFPRYASTRELLLAVGKALDRGFTTVKLHQTPKTTLEGIREVRSKFGGGLGIAVDLNAAFDLRHASDFLRDVRRYEPKWIEEPLWPPDDYDDLRTLVQGSDVPVAAGENEYSLFGFRKMIEAGAAVIQPDVTKVGGLGRFRQVVKLGRSSGVVVAPHLRPHRSALGLAFTLQAASAHPEIATVEYSLAPYPDDLFAGLPTVSKGEASLPPGPGSGIRVRQESLDRYGYQEMDRLLEFSDLSNR